LGNIVVMQRQGKVSESPFLTLVIFIFYICFNFKHLSNNDLSRPNLILLRKILIRKTKRTNSTAVYKLNQNLIIF